jgi:hypothetical protein
LVGFLVQLQQVLYFVTLYLVRCVPIHHFWVD